MTDTDTYIKYFIGVALLGVGYGLIGNVLNDITFLNSTESAMLMLGVLFVTIGVLFTGRGVTE